MQSIDIVKVPFAYLLGCFTSKLKGLTHSYHENDVFAILLALSGGVIIKLWLN